MLDLIHLVKEENGSKGIDTLPSEQQSRQTQQEQPQVPLSKAPQVQQLATAYLQSKPSGKGSGFLTRYKGLRGRKQSQSSERLEGRLSNGGTQELIEYSPLGKGESGEGSLNIEARTSSLGNQEPVQAEEPQNGSFMNKVKAYRAKQKLKGSSRGAEHLEDQGPLLEGIQRQGQQTAKRSSGEGPEAPSMKDFFERVSEAKALLAKITDRQREISAARAKSRTLVSSAEVQASQERIQDEIEDVTTICKKVKVKLDELDVLNAGLLSDDQDDEALLDHPEVKLRLSVMAGLNSKLSEVTLGWQQMRSQWQDEDRAEVARQLHTVTGKHYSPEQVDNLVHNGGTEQIYKQALSNISGATVQQLMTDVQQRHDHIRQLEVSMMELHQVFLDMSILVADQGDTINNIDNWVAATGNTMRASLKQLRSAKEMRRKAATTKAWTFVTGVGLVAGGAGLAATGVGAVAGVPMIVAGAAAIGGSAIGGVT